MLAVVVWYKCGVTGTDAIAAITQDHGYDGAVPLWLYPVKYWRGSESNSLDYETYRVK